eukprot:1139200-Pelagomonas_calceolata.AAC.5
MRFSVAAPICFTAAAWRVSRVQHPYVSQLLHGAFHGCITHMFHSRCMARFTAAAPRFFTAAAPTFSAGRPPLPGALAPWGHLEGGNGLGLR